MSAIPTPEDARQTLREILARMDAFSRWKDTTNERLEALEDENEELRDAVETLKGRLDIVEPKTTSKEHKVRKIVQHAENVRAGDQRGAVMNARNIMAATGVSRRYAYDLIEDLPKRYPWILYRADATHEQYGSMEIDTSKQHRGIVVDCELLHKDPEAVNKFTTHRGGEGD